MTQLKRLVQLILAIATVITMSTIIVLPRLLTKSLTSELDTDLASNEADFNGHRDDVTVQSTPHRFDKQAMDRILSRSPPFVPLDRAVLRKHFPIVSKIAWRIHGSSGLLLHSLMRHQVPRFSTVDWRLKTLSGRVLTVEAVQRTLLQGSQGNPVPNAAHYILPFMEARLRFHHFVSLLSCVHVMRPQLLLLWQPPGRPLGGHWWKALRRNLTGHNWDDRVVMATRQLPQRVYSRPIATPEHQSDVMRLEALLIFGGVYLDLDVVVLKPLDPLRLYDFTIGREHSSGLCNAAMLSAPNASFVAIWHLAYQTFNTADWAIHSVHLPDRLARALPQLCHVEQESMARPNWTPQQVALIYDTGQQARWDWRRRNYLLHLWYRIHNKVYTESQVKKLDSMFGEICRSILYGTASIFN